MKETTNFHKIQNLYIEGDPTVFLWPQIYEFFSVSGNRLKFHQ